MANHHDSGNPDPERMKMLREMMSNREGEAMRPAAHPIRDELRAALGKQNDYPAGMYGKHDEGALAFAVGHDEENEKVLVDFGSPVQSMAMDPQQAIHFAQTLIRKARAATKKPLMVSYPY